MRRSSSAGSPGELRFEPCARAAPPQANDRPPSAGPPEACNTVPRRRSTSEPYSRSPVARSCFSREFLSQRVAVAPPAHTFGAAVRVVKPSSPPATKFRQSAPPRPVWLDPLEHVVGTTPTTLTTVTFSGVLPRQRRFAAATRGCLSAASASSSGYAGERRASAQAGGETGLRRSDRRTATAYCRRRHRRCISFSAPPLTLLPCFSCRVPRCLPFTISMFLRFRLRPFRRRRFDRRRSPRRSNRVALGPRRRRLSRLASKKPSHRCPTSRPGSKAVSR